MEKKDLSSRFSDILAGVFLACVGVLSVSLTAFLVVLLIHWVVNS